MGHDLKQTNWCATLCLSAHVSGPAALALVALHIIGSCLDLHLAHAFTHHHKGGLLYVCWRLSDVDFNIYTAECARTTKPSIKASAPMYDSQVGPVKIGSQHRVALQTMTTTDTRNVQATVDQVLAEHFHFQAGWDLLCVNLQAGEGLAQAETMRIFWRWNPYLHKRHDGSVQVDCIDWNG